MTVAHVFTVAFQGIEAREVDVQVHVGEGGGTGVFNIVGLADKAVAESKERVRAALSDVWAKGGEGGEAVAREILAALDQGDVA